MIRPLVLSLLVPVLSIGCSSSADPHALAEAEILGGVPVDGPTYDAVGSLEVGLPTGRVVYCSATLIAPAVVLTARHCAFLPSASGEPVYLTEDAGLEVSFLVGDDSSAPKRRVRARHSVGAADDAGLGARADVALFSLREPILDVEPIPVSPAALGPEAIGTSFSVMGFGVRNDAGETGRRRMGNVTLGALTGRPFVEAYGSWEAFRTAFEAAAGGPLLDRDLPNIRAHYERTLGSGYEAFFPTNDGDAQVCSGDSGGPLLRFVDGRPMIVGVASWATFKYRYSPLCSGGIAYALFGPTVQELLATTACEAEPVRGRCVGESVVRCAPASEGGPRVTRTSCAALGLGCRIDGAGVAGCAEATRE